MTDTSPLVELGGCELFLSELFMTESGVEAIYLY